MTGVFGVKWSFLFESSIDFNTCFLSLLYLGLHDKTNIHVSATITATAKPTGLIVQLSFNVLFLWPKSLTKKHPTSPNYTARHWIRLAHFSIRKLAATVTAGASILGGVVMAELALGKRNA